MNRLKTITSFFFNSRRLLAVFAALSLPFLSTSCGLLGAGIMTAGIATTAAVSLLPLKLMFACLPEGTMIDTPAGPQAIETLRAGDFVIGFNGEPVHIQQIHGYLEDSVETDFYEIGFSNGAKVDLCRMHRIGGVRAKELSLGDVVEGGFSIVSIRIYQGVERSYDILTEDPGYRVGSIPVNSMIVEMYEAGRSGDVKR